MPGTHQVSTAIFARPDQIAACLLGHRGHRYFHDLAQVQ
ncbi:hypothetical protein I553_4785 [Mycobacterium xenopi 4042]|uniref:Uncharacterized protein n=1 Tax=Mycobacterium xenopi 4042 TaxID=1299334 RepID=X8AHM8_MYCXE|nr:hypothetical protein I553_4785 [Mycobacterium xenopi 4042]